MIDLSGFEGKVCVFL